jgi:outer membrane protein OmpA-like peptidoglycan-associated protein
MNVKVASGLVVVSLSIVFSMVPTAALAQTSRAVDAHYFRPALFGGGIFAVDRAAPLTKWQPGFKFFFNHEGSPLRFTFPQDPATIAAGEKAIGTQEMLEHAQVFNLQAQFALFSWLELGVDFPLVRHSFVSNPDEDTQEGFELLTAGDLIGTIPYAEVAPLDARLGLKFSLLQKAGFSLALAVQGRLPFGDEEVFAGDKGFVFHPRILAGFDWKSLAVAINLGYLLRDESVVLWDDPNTTELKAVPLLGVNDEFTFGVGGVYQFHKLIGVGAELYGSVPLILGSYEAETTTITYPGPNNNLTEPQEIVTKESIDLPGSAVMEVLGGLIIAPVEGLNIGLGGGAGVIGEERKVAYRVFLGMSWLPGMEAPVVGVADRDRDGVIDAKDGCPDEPEDKDGFADDDGCPELDNDQDGVLDAEDKCPDQPEDKDGYQDEDGCPDNDNDGDGVEDSRDGCPDKAEDKDGYQDEDGCPEPDNDGDGIADAQDRCPNEPETFNQFQDEDGCPDSVDTGVTVQKGMITIPEQIQFKRGSAVIEKASFKILDEVAKKIRENPQIGTIRIEGHCDTTGTPDANQRLSDSRADSVRRYLIGKGVRADRLQSVGYGSKRPIASNDTPEGRFKNRRVEFVIIKSK